MGMLQSLLSKLDINVSLVNPFQMQTKGEMMRTCKDLDFLNAHYQDTLSCSHPDQGRWTGETVGHWWGVFTLYYKKSCNKSRRTE